MVDAMPMTFDGGKKPLDFEETELRLGLPGAGDKKRGFEEIVDLKLNLSSKDSASDQTGFDGNNLNDAAKTDSVKPPAKYASLSPLSSLIKLCYCVKSLTMRFRFSFILIMKLAT